MFVLPLPPSINESLMPSRGRLIKSPIAREWRKEACILLKKQMIEKKRVMLKNQLAASYIFYMPDNRRRDQHNYVKQLADCIKDAGLIEDDSLLFHETIAKKIIKGKREVHFDVWEINREENVVYQ